MNHIFNNIRIPDDKTIIDNLEEFKIMLESQRLYCYQCQSELASLNDNYNKRISGAELRACNTIADLYNVIIKL